MTVEIRPQGGRDAAAVRRVLTDAFGDDATVADLAQALQARPEQGAQLVAVDGERIVGFVGLSISWVDAPSRLVEVLVLSPLAVDPARQRQGVGAALQAAALDAAELLGAPLVFLEGDPGYYRRHGWQPAAELGFLPPSPRIPLPAFQVRPLAGWNRATMHGPLVYNDTFWAHDCVGLRA